MIVLYKQTEAKIVNAINDALMAGLPMFCVEAMVKNIFTEIQQQTNQQYDAALQTREVAPDEETTGS